MIQQICCLGLQTLVMGRFFSLSPFLNRGGTDAAMVQAAGDVDGTQYIENSA